MKIKQSVIFFAFVVLVAAPTTVWAVTMKVSPNLRTVATTSEATTSARNIEVNVESVNGNVQIPVEIKGINPQPEPPKPVEVNSVRTNDSNNSTSTIIGGSEISSQPVSPLEKNDVIANTLNLVSLNPQPEPPLPGARVTNLLQLATQLNSGDGQQVMSGKVESPIKGFSINAEKIGNGNVLKFEKSESGNATSTTLALDAKDIKFVLAGSKINIASDTLDFSAVADKTPVVEIKTRNSSSSAPTIVKVKMINNNAILSFANGNGEGAVTIKSDFTIQDGKVVLSGASGEIGLAQNPDSFYVGLEKGLKNKDKGVQIKSVDLRIKDGKPVYEVGVQEPVKLFGFIPMTINSEIIANGIDNSVTGVNRPWYSFLASTSDIPSVKLVPDFAVTNIELVPNTYKKGDTIEAKVTISNVGTAIGVSHYDIMSGSCTTIVYYWGQNKIQWYCSLLALNIGESATYEFNISNAQCDQFRVAYDPGQSVKDDPDYSNNIGYAQGNCSQ